MNFDWSNYLKLADLIYQEATGNASNCFSQEAFYRCSISRAYYSVFCRTRNYLEEKKHVKFSSDEHKKVRDYCINDSNKSLRTIGNQLKRLHQDRKKADYDNSIEHESPAMKAQKSIKVAKKIESELSALI